MKRILVLLLICLAIRETLSFQTNYPNYCEEIGVLGNWTGLYFKFLPQQNQYCLFIFDGEGYPTINDMNQYFVSEQIYPIEGNIQYCDFIIIPPIYYQCRYQDGYMNTDLGIIGQEKDLRLQGFGNEQLMMGQNMQEVQKNEVAFKGQIQIRPENQLSQFGQKMQNALENIKKNGFGISTCSNMSGVYSGRLLETEGQNLVCAFEIIAEIQATESKIQLNVKQVRNGKAYGFGQKDICFNANFIIEMDCNSEQQNFLKKESGTSNVIGGVFSDDMVFISNYQKKPQTIILVRD